MLALSGLGDQQELWCGQADRLDSLVVSTTAEPFVGASGFPYGALLEPPARE